MTTTVNKREVAAQVAPQTGVTQLLAREAILVIFDTIYKPLHHEIEKSPRIEKRVPPDSRFSFLISHFTFLVRPGIDAGAGAAFRRIFGENLFRKLG